MLIQFGESAIEVFKKRGLTPTDLISIFNFFRKHLGDKWLKKISERPITDQSTAVQICEAAIILNLLENCPGFNTVIKAIRNSSEISLYMPEGDWFQIYVGSVLVLNKEEIQFEKSIRGSAPKDIVLREKTVQIECKAFLMSEWVKIIWRAHAETFRAISNLFPKGNWRVSINRDWNERRDLGDVIECIKMIPDFNAEQIAKKAPYLQVIPSAHKMEPTGSWDPEKIKMMGIFGTATPSEGIEMPFSAAYANGVSILFEGPHFDQFTRYENAISEKHYQMVDGACNILAMNTDSFTGDTNSLPRKLNDVLSNRQIDKISGLLLVSKKSNLESSALKLFLLENPRASVPVPSDLKKKLTGEYYLNVAF